MARLVQHPAGTVAVLRTRLAALAIIVAVVTATTGSALAAQAHPTCVTKHHGCGRTASLTTCCCGESGQRSDQSAPVTPRAQVVADFHATPVSLVAPVSASPAERIVRPRAFPPGATPPDLLSLFATLLI